MSREYTREEVRREFLECIDNFIWYWLRRDSEHHKTEAERMSGLVHSILAMIDGAGPLPGFILAPRPHESDKNFHQDEGENWYPENHKIEEQINSDIAGALHDTWYQVHQHREIKMEDKDDTRT